jgi:hypothetical protein
MSTEQLTALNLVFCGPSDVAKEIDIGKDIVDHWNQRHAEARGLWVKHHHWQTDTYPDLSERAQNIPNRQLIDKCKILVAIFWSRFGTPTGVADSGTQEEILRAVDLGRKVMVYFSGLEKPSDTDTRQRDLLLRFKQSLQPRGICRNFTSRVEFRKLFENDLALVLNAFEPKPERPKPVPRPHPRVSQKARTEKGNIYQNVGDTYHYAHPPTKKIIRERRPGSVTTEEVYQINEWIKELAEGEVGRTRDEAFAMWGGRFKNRFHLGHREDLPSNKMRDAEEWYQVQKAMQKRGLKRKAPDLYRTERISSIKAAMGEMGKTNETYYPELSMRLRLRKPFSSLKQLTTRNLDRVYSMVRADARNRRGC